MHFRMHLWVLLHPRMALMLDKQLPDLTFPMVKFGRRETQWTLSPLLYKGGAAVPINKVAQPIASGELGQPLNERVILVRKLHDELTTGLVAGGKKSTAGAAILALSTFFTWAEQAERPLSMETVATTYVAWADYLLYKVRVEKTFSISTAYGKARIVGALLDYCLDRVKPLLVTTALREQKHTASVLGVAADKQNLADTFDFGHMLTDICAALSEDVVFGPLPVQISLRRGGHLVLYNKLPELHKRQPKDKTAKEAHLRVRAPLVERDITKRSVIINTRIEAELLLFIAQTGMNLTQAQQLTTRHFSYK
jgi:hypothetical protein